MTENFEICSAASLTFSEYFPSVIQFNNEGCVNAAAVSFTVSVYALPGKLSAFSNIFINDILEPFSKISPTLSEYAPSVAKSNIEF